MKKGSLFALVVFCFIACQSYAQIKWDTAKFMPLSEVKLGMKGKGYTVFSGVTVEPFDFEVVSIQYNRYPRQHIIWAKGLSENFKRTGSAGGMSGSPVYIDGRLFGALARSHRDQRRYGNLFGITPIESMIEVTERDMHPNLAYQGTQIFQLDTAITTEGINTVPSLFAGNDNRYEQRPSGRNTAGQSQTQDIPTFADSDRLAIPITLPGIDSEAMRFYKPLFDTLNLIPLEAAGGGSPIKETPIEAGQTIGVASARGAYDAFGFGTITYIDGDQFIAYGHARNDEGHVNLPVSAGYVHHIVPARYRSYKVASATQPIGTLVQDRDHAIAGNIGEHPSYIPITLKMETSDGKQHDLFYEVIRHRSFSPVYAELGTVYLIEAFDFAAAEHTLTIDAKLTLKEHPELTSREIVSKNVYSSNSPASGVRQTLRTPLLHLIGNSYANVEIEAINLDLKLEAKRRNAVIESLRVDKQRYRPGETVEVIVTLRPYFEKPITLIGTVTIPDDAPDGLITVLAMNATADEKWRRSRAPLNFRPKNINQLIKILQHNESNTDIILELFVLEPGLTVQGEEFANLPTSVMSVMNTGKQIGESGYTEATTLHRNKISTDYVVFGSGALELVVDSNAP